MSITNATRLSDFAAGIGTEGAILKIDNANQRVGIGTQLPNQMLTVAGIVSATQYIGDGSQLEGITSAGLGTAIDETEGSAGAVVYYTDDLLTVAETTTINPPASASAAYTQYRDVKLNDSVDLIIETGDDFIPDILGFGEDTTDPNAAGNGVFDEVYAGIIKNKNGLGAPAFANGLTSVGVITATGGFSGDVTGNVNNSSNLVLKVDGGEKGRLNSAGNFGLGIASPTAKLDVRRGDADGKIAELHQSTGYGLDIGSSEADAYISSGYLQNFIFKTNRGTGQLERLRINKEGAIGLGGANYGTSGQVITSQGSGAAPQWADVAAGMSEYDVWAITATSSFAEWDYQVIGNHSVTVNIARQTTTQNATFTKIGTGMSYSAGVWTFPSTGYWECTFRPMMQWGSSVGTNHMRMELTVNNGTDWNVITFLENSGAGTNYQFTDQAVYNMLNITDVSQQKLRYTWKSDSQSALQGSTNYLRSHYIWKKVA